MNLWGANPCQSRCAPACNQKGKAVVLYKYRRDSEYTAKIFITGKVRLSTAAQLNDPFECSLHEIAPDWIAAQVREMKAAQLEGFLVSLPPDELSRFRTAPDFDGLYQAYRNFIKQRFGNPPSDPELVFTRLEEQLQEVGIFSLSEVPDNQLMWAHYTEDHKGLCLGFEVVDGSLLANPEHCLRVNYADKIPKMSEGFLQKITFRLDSRCRLESRSEIAFSDPAVRAAVSTKPRCWKYEREWRYVEPRAGDYPWPGPLVEIIFGLRCSRERREYYMQLASLFVGNDLRVYEMRKIANSNSLERIQLPLLTPMAVANQSVLAPTECQETPEVGLAQAKALANASEGEPDPRRCETLADRISTLLARHDTPVIAVHLAMTLTNATATERDPRRCEALVDRIGGLLARHDTPEIAFAQAVALVNAIATEPDPRRCEALADRIGALLARHDTPEIALQQAQALYNATVDEPDPRRCEALADRIGGLLARHDTPEIAFQQAKALYSATVDEPDPRRCEALADRIGGLLARHDTPEIAFQRAQALRRTTEAEPGPGRRETLADRIGGLLVRHDTPEIALEQAQALYKWLLDEPDPRLCEAVADRIGELLARHDTPEIALYQAEALYNATVDEPDAARREALASRIGGLLACHDTAEIALDQAKALHSATAAELDPSRCEALASRIGELLTRHDTPDIALEQAKALRNATLIQPDRQRREALADSIGKLAARYGFSLA